MLFEEKQGVGPPKKPLNQKKPQVKMRKWVKKKNGLFGWITCVGGPGKSEVPPKLGGGGTEKQTRELMSLVGDGQLLV